MTTRTVSSSMRRYICLGIIFCFISISFAQGDQEAQERQTQVITDRFQVSEVSIIDDNEIVTLAAPEANSFTMIPGEYKIPCIKKVYEFPVGTRIKKVQVSLDTISSMVFDFPVERIPLFQEMNGEKTLGFLKKDPVDENVYPSSSFDVHTGVGLNKDNIHVLFLSLTVYPIHLDVTNHVVNCAHDITVDIQVDSPDQQVQESRNTHDPGLLIITHNSYASLLGPFVEQKQEYGLSVRVVTVDEIYTTYSGQDQAEKIKYCVKHAVEEWGTVYVLILGDIKQVPMREAYCYPWSPYHGKGILTDLYYADIYDSEMNFCDWNANKNDLFGEATLEGFPPLDDQNIDEVDLYADVHIGRIPCSTNDELNTVLNKIMVYEARTYNQIWFQKILLAGGDTFGLSKGSPLFQYEGEITNVKVGQQLPEFEQTRIWASERTLHPWTFNQEISKGVGFVSYAGHGFEHGWGTYRPNAILDGNLIFYFTPYLRFISNEHKLPIIFFDACLTAKLDFNISDMIDYFGWKARLVSTLLGGHTSDEYFDVFAWAILKLESGGCVANIGATRPAYTYVDRDGVYAGAGYLDVHFFKAYEEGVTVGEMLTSAQRDYANYVGKDFFTIEEYILLGDPSLMVGGYP